MKEVEYISFNELKKEYMEKHNTWKIEQEILNSFSKKELKNFIEDINKNYLKEFMLYKHILMRKKFKAGYEKLNKIEIFFIEQMEYYFNGGEEFDRTKFFIDKLKKFYKLNYEEKNKFQKFKKFDVNSVSITEVLSNYIKIPNSLNRNIKCPLHKEKSGSFRVYKNSNSFYCFGCHKGGGIVEFVSEIENITKKEAFKKLAKLYSNY